MNEVFTKKGFWELGTKFEAFFGFGPSAARIGIGGIGGMMVSWETTAMFLRRKDIFSSFTWPRCNQLQRCNMSSSVKFEPPVSPWTLLPTLTAGTARALKGWWVNQLSEECWAIYYIYLLHVYPSKASQWLPSPELAKVRQLHRFSQHQPVPRSQHRIPQAKCRKVSEFFPGWPDMLPTRSTTQRLRQLCLAVIETLQQGHAAGLATARLADQSHHLRHVTHRVCWFLSSSCMACQKKPSAWLESAWKLTFLSTCASGPAPNSPQRKQIKEYQCTLSS